MWSERIGSGRLREAVESRPWKQGGRNLGIRLRGKSGLRGWKRLKARVRPPKLAALRQLCGLTLNAFSTP